MAKPAKGGKGRGGGFNLARVAEQQVQAAEQPVFDQIAAERAANLARAQQQMGFAKAAAALMQQAAPHVQQGYTDAANADAVYARGLGGQVQGILDENAQRHGSNAPPVGDLAYGTGGYLPATTLQREGAAWGAAAQLAPGNVLGRGQQDVAATLSNDPELAKLQDHLAEIASTAPAVYQHLLAQYTQMQQGQQRIGIERFNAQTMAAYRQASLQMQQERIGLTSRKDAASIALAISKGHMPNAALSGRYGYIVDGYGNAILNKRGKKILVKTAKKSGFLPLGVKKNPNGAGLYQGVGGQVGAAGKGVESAAQRAAGGLIVKLAHQFVGTPYVWGGESPKGFDCSGFAQWLYGKAGVAIPRVSYEQWLAPNGTPVAAKQLLPGDLVFYKGSDPHVINGRILPGHVGIYIGHGKIINAYGTGYGVRVDNVFSPGLGGYMGGRRYR